MWWSEPVPQWRWFGGESQPLCYLPESCSVRTRCSCSVVWFSFCFEHFFLGGGFCLFSSPLVRVFDTLPVHQGLSQSDGDTQPTRESRAKQIGAKVAEVGLGGAP